jgi:hypothetical protein
VTRLLCTSLMLVICAACSATSARTTHFADVPQYLGPAAEVTLRRADGTTSAGRIDLLSQASVTLVEGAATRDYPREQIVSIAHRERRIRLGLKDGVLVGIAAGIAVTFLPHLLEEVDVLCVTPQEKRAWVRATWPALPVSTVIGAIGGLIKGSKRTLRPVYARPEPPSPKSR